MECQYCHKTYSSRTNLLIHQKTARFCLKIQGKEIEDKFKCELCGEVFNNKRGCIQHYNACSTNPAVMSLLRRINEIKIINEQEVSALNEKIEFKDKQILTYEITLESKREKISNLKRENNKLNKRFDNIVSKPTTIVQNNHHDNSTNITFAPINLNTCKGYSEFLTDDHVEAGASGIARYALEYPLKNSYTVTDADRKLIKYNNGREIVQSSVAPLRQIICESLSDKYHELRTNKARVENEKVLRGITTLEEAMEKVIHFGDACDAITKSAKTGDDEKTDFDHELESNLISYQV